MKKILITGGSGFIGTNLTQLFVDQGFEVCNIDKKPPLNANHIKYWIKADVTELDDFEQKTLAFMPEYIVHLAARVDLDGKTLSDYSANTLGVSNLLKIVKKVKVLKKLIITSSMFVCKAGYAPKDQFDFLPTTIYGESKVETERLVWESPPVCDWVIIRPTSIWGPWFSTPYRDFFDYIISGRYVKFGKKACVKTYGYVGNAVDQINCLLFADTKEVAEKVFYIGDSFPTDINQWADEIAAEIGKRILTIPFALICLAAWGGDFLKCLGISFPMTSFRLKNMTTDNILDVSKTVRVAPNPPFTRLRGVQQTLSWLMSQQSSTD